MIIIESILRAKRASEVYRGRCAPNPAVGAILLKEGQMVSEGVHRGCGNPHAEVEAICAAGDKTQGATLCVTLEPCCHHGRTPPCTDAIIEAGIKEVFYAYTDPNPLVAGKGAAILESAGIPCQKVDVPEVTAMYRAYAHWVKTGRPYLRAKLACSLDGKIAHAGGKPAAISGEQAARKTAIDRLHADAILTSINTVLADDPQLNVRQEGKITPKPVWVLDSKLRFPKSARLWHTASQLVLCHSHTLYKDALSAFSKTAAQLQAIAEDESGRLSWEALLLDMGSQGLHEVWVEAGPTLVESLLASGYLNELIVSVSPCVLGPDAMPGFQAVGDLMKGSSSVEWQPLGETARCTILY